MFQIMNPGGWQEEFQYKGKKVISILRILLCSVSVARISDAFAAQTISLAVQVEEFKAILPKDEVWNLCM